jgi:thioredoxin-like negative regulator of GroEL
MASVLNEIAGATKGRAIIGLVSTKDGELVRTFGIRKMPTIFIVRNAAITASFIGLVPRKTIEQALQ